MSTIVRTKKAIVNALGKRAGLSAVQITYGDDVARPRKERIFTGDVEDHDAEPATMRASKVRTQETYTLRLLVTVDSKKGHEATEERALVLLGEVETLLAEDPKLTTADTPPGIDWATFGGFRLATSIVAEGEHRTLIEADVNVRARNS